MFLTWNIHVSSGNKEHTITMFKKQPIIIHSHSTRQASHYHLPPLRTSLDKNKKIIIAAQTLWNDLGTTLNKNR